MLSLLASVHGQLAAFARESYKLDGRGVIRVAIPATPPGVVGLAETEMVYHVVEHVLTLTAGFKGSQREDADTLIRMLETYDPATQAVVMVAFEDRRDPPISVKMRFDVPLLVEDPGGVH